jgi:hypothetical protein
MPILLSSEVAGIHGYLDPLEGTAMYLYTRIPFSPSSHNAIDN